MDFSQQLRAGAAEGLYGGLLPAEVLAREKDFFTQSLVWEPIAAATTATRDVVIQNDADFLIVSIAGVVFDAGAITQPTTRPLRLAITDTGSGRNFQSRAMWWDSIVGSGQLPGYWPYPKIVPRASTISVELANIAPADAYDVNILLVGFKVFG